MFTTFQSIFSIQFYRSAANGKIEIVKRAIALGLHKNDTEGFALALAAEKGHYKIVKLLLKAGVSANSYGLEHMPALTLALINDKLSIAKLLMTYGADVNARNAFGETALIKVIKKANFDIIRVLLIHNADVNIAAKDGTTVLMEAVLHASYDVIKLLLDAGADVNARNKNDVTPMGLICADVKFKNLVKLLASAGGEVQGMACSSSLGIVNQGKEIFENIYESVKTGSLIDGQMRRIKIISKIGFSLNIKDHKGNSPLHHAIVNSDKMMIVTLLGHNPKLIEAKNNIDLTPIGLVVENDNFNLLKLFLNLAYIGV